MFAAKDQKKRKRLGIVILLVLILSEAFFIERSSADIVRPVTNSAIVNKCDFIKYVDFDVPYGALQKALNLDVASHESDKQLHWVELLSYLANKYGGNWQRYRARDLDELVGKMRKGETIANLTNKSKYYSYFYEAYEAALGNFVGEYQIQVPDPADKNKRVLVTKYGLKVFSPIAAGYGYGHYDDFGNSRSFGFARRHQGNDLMGTVGTPIIAVEGGVVESLGWNEFGGWRVGIRSFDKKRYYYYAHMRKDHPYVADLKEGEIIHSGDVIGYLGMTGYSLKENVNGMQKPHLHFGMELIFDESQKESDNEIWINVYDIVNLLYQNRVSVKLDGSGKDYTRVYDFVDLRYQLYYE